MVLSLIKAIFLLKDKCPMRLVSFMCGKKNPDFHLLENIERVHPPLKMSCECQGDPVHYLLWLNKLLSNRFSRGIQSPAMLVPKFSSLDYFRSIMGFNF